MPVGNKKEAIEVILHTHIIAHGTKIVA